MRPQKIEDQPLLEGLMSVLRSKGYDGSSLNELAESSGLQKASLYHRFPGGKKEITSSVLSYANKWIYENIYSLLSNQSIAPDERLMQVIDNINVLYKHGEAVCILRALSLDTGIKLFGDEIKESMQYWIAGFSALGEAFGFSEEVARNKAFQVLINIQGSLVVAKGLNSPETFQSALANIRTMYQQK